jgi:hypothetical protein
LELVMSEDIVEFGTASSPRKKAARPRIRPAWFSSKSRLARPLGILGAILGSASLVGPWQKVVPNSHPTAAGPDDESYVAMLASLGVFGIAYLLSLIGSITTLALVLYGHQGVRINARVIGLVLSGATVVNLGAMSYALSKGTGLNGGFVIVGQVERLRWSFTLEWGFYVALAAAVAVGLALLWSGSKPSPEGESRDAPGSTGERDDGEEPDDGVLDLSVSVHPIGKQVA